MYYNKLGIVFLFSLLFTACGNKEEKSNVSGEGKVVEQAEQIETIAFQNKGH